MSTYQKIDIHLIVPNRHQPRLDFDDESIEGLAESIRESGMLQPISVRRIDDHYELIAGERRYRACLLNGEEEIDALVYEMSDEESANLALIENLQREDLNAVEQAMAMRHIMEYEKITQVELARRLGYRQSTVANKIRLLRLPDYIKRALSDGEITERHARALLKVDPERLEDVFHTIVQRGYNVSKTEEYIEALSKKVHRKGVSGNVRIGINTIRQSYELCRTSGIDADMQVTEYEDTVKIVIRMKK
ncbi:MAG: ParB/RepB/Spo0J family partition protein [Erysipelotrichaceae bacterium]|nr:ParB/RepB/Spo0J family partition protein [Erysipelotrichaceae bacterium]